MKKRKKDIVTDMFVKTIGSKEYHFGFFCLCKIDQEKYAIYREAEIFSVWRIEKETQIYFALTEVNKFEEDLITLLLKSVPLFLIIEEEIPTAYIILAIYELDESSYIFFSDMGCSFEYRRMEIQTGKGHMDPRIRTETVNEFFDRDSIIIYQKTKKVLVPF